MALDNSDRLKKFDTLPDDSIVSDQVCHARRLDLSAREQDFIRSMMGWAGTPTEKQLAWLVNIYVRLNDAGAGR